MLSKSFSAAAAMAIMGLGAASAGNVTFGRPEPRLDPRRSAFRKGRRFNYGLGPVARGGNHAGTKLAKKAAKGQLGIARLR